MVKVADGALDNWDFLAKDLPLGVEVVDFYHAAEHLKRAFEHAYGEDSVKSRTSFAEYRHVLLEVEDGVDKMIRTLAYPCPARTKPTAQSIRPPTTRQLGSIQRSAEV